MAEIGKLNIYSYKDREKIMTLPCAFCGEYEIAFMGSKGYESHFSDSKFDCLTCGCSYPVILFENKNLVECKELMERIAAGYYIQLMSEYKEKHAITEKLEERIKMYENNYNPSKRDLLGKEH